MQITFTIDEQARQNLEILRRRGLPPGEQRTVSEVLNRLLRGHSAGLDLEFQIEAGEPA
jgi:hypothetical protein